MSLFEVIYTSQMLPRLLGTLHKSGIQTMVSVFTVPNHCVRNKRGIVYISNETVLLFRFTELALYGRVLVERKVMESIPACSKTDLLLAE